MKTLLRLVPPILFLQFIFPYHVRAQIPVTDVANLANNQVMHTATIAKWVDSINNLRTQIDQLNRQINIQDDIRKWSGNPVEAGAGVVLDGLGATDLLRIYGKTKSAVLGLVNSLDSLQNTGSGNYRAISGLDLDGNEIARDAIAFRRYSVLDGMQVNTEEATAATQEREAALQEEIALTLEEMKAASTDAEVQKLAAKLTALNGQLAQVEAARKREVDAVALQKIANDARLEQERLAAAELAAKDAHVANQRVSAYFNGIKLRKK